MAEHRSHGTSLRESNRSSDNHNNGEAHNKPKTIAAAPAAAPVQGRSPSLPHTPRSPHSRAQAEVKLVRALREELEANRANLTVEKRKELARKLLEHRGKDDTFFTRLNRRMEQHNLELPSVTVEYRNLCVQTDALVGSASIPTVASVPTTFVKRLFGVHDAREARPLRILNNLNGKLRPGRLTVLLGPPSCGKSTFMRALTGRLLPAQGKVSGEITYNGRRVDEFNVQRTAAYVDQVDNHNPNLTVRETLDFAHSCQMGLHGAPYDVPAELAAARRLETQQHVPHQQGRTGAGAGGGGGGPVAEGHGENAEGQDAAADAAAAAAVAPSGGSHNAQGQGQGKGHGSTAGSFVKSVLSARLHHNHEQHLLEDPEDEFEALLRQAWGTRVKVDVVMALLGLAHCAETPCGDQLMRGISGGERKRLTTAEMLVGPCSVVMLDEMSTGLDSATLFTVVRWLGQACRALRMTTVVSLLQPPPEVFGLFDDVMLMTDGRVLYHGPVPDAVPHFRTLGFSCPDRKDVPSYLLEITTPSGQRQFADTELRQRFNLPPPEEEGVVPRSASQSLHQPGVPGRGLGSPVSAESDELPSGKLGEGGEAPAGQRGGSKFRSKALLVSLEEMEQHFWKNNPHGVTMATELRDQPTRPPPGSEGGCSEAGRPAVAPPLVPKAARFALRPHEAVMAATRRQVTLVMRDKVLLKGRIVQVIILGLLTGSLFYNQGVSLNASRTIFGASFMSVLFLSFGGFVQVPLTMEQKKVWYKHRSASFYPAYAQGLAMSLSQLPLSAIEAGVFSLIIYFMVGYYRQPGYFFTYYLVLMATSMSISALFRFMACVCPTMVIANAASGLSIVMLVLTSGFAIVHGSIPDWAIWAYWISPHAYALRSLVVNEMVSPKWQNVPAPPGMPPGLSLGDAALQSFDFYTERKWIWIGVGFLFGFYFIFTYTSILALALLQPEVPAAQLPDPEEVVKARQRAEERRRKFTSLPEASGRLADPGGGAAAARRKALAVRLGVGSKSQGSVALEMGTVSAVPRVDVAEISTANGKSNGTNDRSSGESSHDTGNGSGDGNGNGNGKVVMVAPAAAPVGGNGKAVGGGVGSGSFFAAKGSANGGPPGMVISPSMAALQEYIDISSSLPFTPITLVFQDLKYYVPNPGYSRSAAKAWARAQAARVQGDIDTLSPGSPTSPTSPTSAGSGSGVAKDVELGQGGKGGTGAGGGGGLEAPPPAARERLQLLSGVTGYNEPGVLLALMGGSGAGKTTLMDVIAGRKTIGTIEGSITVNGHKADPQAWSRVMGYVEQNDIHTPAQTVIEALQFSARLRLPPSFTNQQVKAYVEEVLDIVDLLPQLYALVGSPGVSGLSTEARKRLTIAVELVANPSCIFLDEPTSGLDARAASIVMRAVRNVARNGRTVMVTIHQPSIEIFEAFDNLLLIQRGGRTTYFGPLGRHSCDLISYFMAVPGTPALPPGFNPATWMLEVTGGSMATVIDTVQVDWPSIYEQSDLAKKAAATAAELVSAHAATSAPLAVGTTYAMPFGVQVQVLLRKFNLAYWRSPGYNFVRMAMTFTTSFIYAAVYWGEGRVPNPAAMANVQNVMGVMFSSSNFIGMTNLMSVMPVVGYERVVFYRERGASMYDPFAYGVAIALVEMPYLLIQALTFVPIIYWTIAFVPTPEAFFYYVIVFFETIAFYTIFGQTLVYITPAQAIAQVVGGGFNFLFNVFNGFIITYPDIPPGWRWMNRAVPATWILYGLGISQLGDNDNELYYGGQKTTVSQFMSARFGYQYYMRWWVVLILFAYILVFRVGSILALKYWNFLKR